MLRGCEDELAKGSTAPETFRLSDNTAQSLENGNFWIYLAVTYSFSFDEIYLKFIHPKYYGQFESIEDLLNLLNEEDQKKIDEFVQVKMQQMKDGGLDSHRTMAEMIDA